jgi:hypothetical protein
MATQEPCLVHGPQPIPPHRAGRFLKLICCVHLDQQSVVLYRQFPPWGDTIHRYPWSLRWELPYPPPDEDKLRESYHIEFADERIAQAIFEHCRREMLSDATPNSARNWTALLI